MELRQGLLNSSDIIHLYPHTSPIEPPSSATPSAMAFVPFPFHSVDNPCCLQVDQARYVGMLFADTHLLADKLSRLALSLFPIAELKAFPLKQIQGSLSYFQIVCLVLRLPNGTLGQHNT